MRYWYTDMQLTSAWGRMSFASPILFAMLLLGGFAQGARANTLATGEDDHDPTRSHSVSVGSLTSEFENHEDSTKPDLTAIDPAQEFGSVSLPPFPILALETDFGGENYYGDTVAISTSFDIEFPRSSLDRDERSHFTEPSSLSDEPVEVQLMAEAVPVQDSIETRQEIDPVSETDTLESIGDSGSIVSSAELLTAQAEDMEVSVSNNWHFRITPYVYLPFNVNGSITARGIRADTDLGVDDILDSLGSLNWALFGRVEGFSPDYRFGLFIDAAYISTTNNEATAIPVDTLLNQRVRTEVANRLPQLIERRLPAAAARLFPDGVPDRASLNNIPIEQLRPALQSRIIQLRDRLSQRIPNEFRVNANASLDIGKFDFGLTYRLYDPSEVNPDGIESEFDLGPIVFDIIVGARVYTFDLSIDLETDIPGIGDRSFNENKTIVEPLIGGALRFNLSPTFAVNSRFDVSGFGWDNMTLSWATMLGMDWMFSGNTSLTAGYRVSQILYNQGRGANRTSIDVTQHGPYLGLSFRF
jgi:hypothetical protein